MYKIDIYRNKDNMKAVIVDGELACFYVIRDNGEICITRADESDDEFIFLESMLDIDDFEYVDHFYTSHVNNLYDLVEEGEVIC